MYTDNNTVTYTVVKYMGRGGGVFCCARQQTMLELLQGVHYSWLLTSYKIMSLLSFIFDSLKIHPPLDPFPLKQNYVVVFSVQCKSAYYLGLGA